MAIWWLPLKIIGVTFQAIVLLCIPSFLMHSESEERRYIIFVGKRYQVFAVVHITQLIIFTLYLYIFLSCT